jgi:membrane-bound lytic murein transglycosylase B
MFLRISLLIRSLAHQLGRLAIIAALLSCAPATTEAGQNNKAFREWLAALRDEARGQGISDATLTAALKDVAPIPRVIELDRKQAEFSLTYYRYLEVTQPPARVERGRQLLQENAALLADIETRFGVQPEFLVALWGMESNFGQNMGSFPVIAALATLAYDGRRSAFFRKELFLALKILDQGHIQPAAMRGSWAGAMGQNQFMPSSFVNNAIDFDGDGRRDIWSTPADVLASAANYLARSGWKKGEPWGYRVMVPADIAAGAGQSTANLEAPKAIAAWREAGVKLWDGRDLPDSPAEGTLVQPAGADGPAFLVFDNFRAVMKWNRAIFFATSAGLLADRLAGR